MSRAIFLNMTERSLILHCEAKKIGISVISKLPTGGTRLVTMSMRGAEQIRRDFKSKLTDDTRRKRVRRPSSLLPFRV